MVYKIILKIMDPRLCALLPTMISNTQSAFVKGRLLVENVLLATELVQGFNQTNISSRGLLKVDIRKAFDSVSWQFITQILKSANFSDVFINWIEQCIITTSLSINVNGNLCGYFKGTKGLRQGDLFSSHLFVMAMEVFANLLASSLEHVLLDTIQRLRMERLSLF